MVKSLTKKNTNIKIIPLKNQLDFERVNPKFRKVKKKPKYVIIKKTTKPSADEYVIVNKNLDVFAPPEPPKEEIKKNEPSTTEFPKYISKSFILNGAETFFEDIHYHIGIIVGKKTVAKLAVKRNLIKRRLRAILNEHIRKYDLSEYDFVLTARKDIITTTYQELETEIQKALSSISKNIRWHNKNKNYY